MTKERWSYILLGLFVAALLVVGIVGFVPTRDDGLRWFNEEFWVSLTITFLSVAASIALTVLISWKLFNKQLEVQKESERVARENQLADLREQFHQEARIRQAAGLVEALGGLHFYVRRMRLNTNARMFLKDRFHEQTHAFDAPEARLIGQPEILHFMANTKALVGLWVGAIRAESFQVQLSPRHVDIGEWLEELILYWQSAIPEWERAGHFHVETEIVESMRAVAIELGVTPPSG